MELNKVKELQSKMTDYTQFAYILLTVSVFLYIGVLIPAEGKEELQVYLLMGTTALFLSLSFFFFVKVIKYKREINNMEEQK